MKSFLIALCLLVGLIFTAQAQASWQWARNVQKVNVTATAADAAGNVYVTGSFAAPVSFTSPYFAGTLTLTPLGASDLFLACFDAAGNLRWARQTGGSGATASGSGVAADAAGGVYVAGTFQGTLTANVGSGSLAAPFYSSAYVARYAASTGTAYWSRRIGNDAYNCGGHAVAVGPGNGCYVAGILGFGVSFGSFSAGSGRRSGFVAQYTAAGTANWATAGATTGPSTSTSGSEIFGVASDAAGNCYVTGAFRTGLQFGGASLPDNGWFTNHTFVARLNPGTGAAAWLRGSTGSSSTTAAGAAVSVAGGGCYVGGTFDGTTAFGGIYTLTPAYPTSGFVGRYDAATGATSWVRPVGYPTGSVDVAASSTDVLVSLGINASPGYSKLASYAASGVYQWGLTTAGPGSSRSLGLALSGGAIYWLGSYENSCSFGPFGLSTPAGTTYAYLARLAVPAARPAAPSAAAVAEVYPNPAVDELQIQLQAATQERVRVTVRNAFGQVLFDEARPARDALRLNVQGWKPGLYVVQLQGAGLQQTRQVRVK